MDCVRFQAIVNDSSPIPVSATNFGLYARSALVSNPVMTPVVLSGLSQVNEDELLVAHDELTKARFGSHAYQALHFHLVGSSVDYSLSPAMHNTAFKFLGMQHTYRTRQTRRITDLLSLVDDTCGGFSVTLPFKLEVMHHLDSMSDAAKAIQAVNTVIPRRHGAETDGSHPLYRCHRNKAGPITGLHGENTDWIALRTCIARHLSTANSVTPSTSALVIGAGGMAKAAIYALIQLHVEHIFIWNRTGSRAEQVAEHFNALFPSPASSTGPRIRLLQRLDTPWPEAAQQPSIVVCTPPIHEIDGEPGLDFQVPNPWFQSPTGGVIIEVCMPNQIHRTFLCRWILAYYTFLFFQQLSYKTPWTRLMQQAHDNAHRGWVCVEPLEILIEQGCAQFELFTGFPAPKKRMTDCVVRQFQAETHRAKLFKPWSSGATVSVRAGGTSTYENGLVRTDEEREAINITALTARWTSPRPLWEQVIRQRYTVSARVMNGLINEGALRLQHYYLSAEQEPKSSDICHQSADVYVRPPL
jgi:shikimate 5-dehydrogenase